MPVGITSGKNNILSQTTQDVILILGDAQQIFLSDLLTLARRGSVSHVRENSLSLAIIAALRSSLRVQTPEGSLTVCKLLGEQDKYINIHIVSDGITNRHIRFRHRIPGNA
jgi:separase